MALITSFFLYTDSDAAKISRQLELAQRYLTEEDYEQAIIAFEEAIQIDPQNTEAYLGLAEAYIATGDMEQAVSTLEEAYAITKSDELLVRKEAYEAEWEQRLTELVAVASNVQTSALPEMDTVAQEKNSPTLSETSAQEESLLSASTQSTVDSETDDNVSSVTTGFVERDGKLYYYDEQGNLVTGWFEVDGKRCCARADGSLYRAGEYEIDGVLYQFGEDALCLGEVQQKPIGADEVQEQMEADVGEFVQTAQPETLYYEDGSFEIYTYDVQGNRIKEEYYSDGTLHMVYIYDAQGNWIKKEQCTDGTVPNIIYTYDEQWRCVRQEWYFPDDDLTRDMFYTYDAQGNCIHEEWRFSNGSYRIWDYEGDYCIKEESYSPGVGGSGSVYTYDAEGNCVNEEWYRIDEN